MHSPLPPPSSANARPTCRRPRAPLALPAIRPRSTSVPPAEEAERRGQPWTPPQPLLQLRSLGGLLPQPLLQLRVAAAGAVQLGLRHSVELAGPPPPLELAGLLRLREELPRGARPGGTRGTARG